MRRCGAGMKIPDHFVRVIELPLAVKGVTVPNEDGTFSVYINSLYDTPTQRQTLEHELEHLARDHFYKSESVARQEAEANGVSPPRPGRRRGRGAFTPVLPPWSGISGPSARWRRPSRTWGSPCLILIICFSPDSLRFRGNPDILMGTKDPTYRRLCG